MPSMAFPPALIPLSRFHFQKPHLSVFFLGPLSFFPCTCSDAFVYLKIWFSTELVEQKLLREDWGFQGYITSDSNAVIDIYSNHHYVDSAAEAVVSALKAGTDMDSNLQHGMATREEPGQLFFLFFPKGNENTSKFLPLSSLFQLYLCVCMYQYRSQEHWKPLCRSH